MLKYSYSIVLSLIVFFLTFAIYIFFLVAFSGSEVEVTQKYNNIVILLPPIGIILSALLASISVLRTIENTNRIEKEKAEKNKTEIKKISEIYILKLTQSFYDFFDIKDPLNATTLRIKEDYNLIIKNRDIVNYLDNYLLDIMNIIDNFIEVNTFIVDSINESKDKISQTKIIELKINKVEFSKKTYNDYIQKLKKLDEDNILNIKEFILGKELKWVIQISFYFFKLK